MKLFLDKYIVKDVIGNRFGEGFINIWILEIKWLDLERRIEF